MREMFRDRNFRDRKHWVHFEEPMLFMVYQTQRSQSEKRMKHINLIPGPIANPTLVILALIDIALKIF